MAGQPLFDWTINLGHVITILAFLGGGYAFVIAMRNELSSLSKRVVAAEDKLTKLVEILVAQGKQEVRLDSMDQRLNLHGQRLDRALERFEDYVDTKK